MMMADVGKLMLAQTGFTAVQLTAWRERMGYSQRDACKALGCSRNAWAGWENGTQDVPHYIGLACAALALGLTASGEDRPEL